MNGMIVAHEEVLAAIVEAHGAATLDRLENMLSVSKTTLRRRCEELVSRGWLQRQRSRPPRGRYAFAYVVTTRGCEAHRDREGF